MAKNYYDWAGGGRGEGWIPSVFKFFGGNPNYTKGNLKKWYEDQFKDANISDDVRAYINSLDDDAFEALARKAAETERLNFMGSTIYDISYDDLLKSLQDLGNVQAGPKLSDYLGDYKQEAIDAINAENEDILRMYDENLNRQTNNFNAELNNINRGYNDYARQVLSNDYQKNAALLGTYQSDMSRARQNALEAGANAGLRIAGNINTLLSAQNKQAATSLETSNQLAQAMLNQRNAASSVRGQYGNMLNQDTQNRANLKAGTYERTKAAQSNLYNERMNDYNVANQIATEKNGNYVDNAFYDSYTNYKKANNY